MQPRFLKFLVLILVAALTLAAADKKPAEKKKGAKVDDAKAAKAGDAIFSKNCAVCHNTDSTAEKFGSPGLKGLYKAEKLPHSGKPVNDENVTERIVKGSDKMPPFEKKLSKRELANVLAYLETL